MRVVVAFLCALCLTACASAPPNLTPTGARTYRANQGVVAAGMVQHTAIELNKIQVCDPLPCHPLLSDANTRVVVENVTSALRVVRTVCSASGCTSDSWKPTLLASMMEVRMRLDAAGRTALGSYLEAAISVIDALIP